jgi:hypothetical protein
MAVTPSRATASRNALAGTVDFFDGVVALDPEWWCSRWGGRRSCESRNGVPHCPTCHTPTHVWCHECGDSLEELRDGSQGVTRVDRCYCSNACRQRAYRRRQQKGTHNG